MRHTPYERLPPPYAATRTTAISPRPSRSPSSSMTYTVFNSASPTLAHPAHSRAYNFEPAHCQSHISPPPQAYSSYPVQPDQAMYTSQFTAIVPQTTRNLASASPIRCRDSNSPVRRQELEEKRRRSHSNMERKRREKTNDIIKELKLLVPGLRDQKNLQKLDVLQGTLDFVKEILGSSENSLSNSSAENKSTASEQDKQPDNNARRSSSTTPAEKPRARHHRRSAVAKSLDSAINTACQDEHTADTGAMPSLLAPASTDQSESISSSLSFLPAVCDSDALAEEPSSPSKSSIGFITA